MTTITIQLPDKLRQRAERAATRRGGTIDTLFQELLEEYLEETDDGQATSETKERVASGIDRISSHNDLLDEEDPYPSLEEVVAKIKATPSDPSKIHPATQSLVELLANAPRDPSFDEEAWNCEWAKVEAEIKAITHANDRAEGRA